MTGPTLLTLLLADGRLPTGGHVHSAGVEQAVDSGLVTDVDELATWLTARLITVGRVEATLAAVGHREATGTTLYGWHLLVAEAEARTAVPHLRDVARTRGRQFLRLARRLLEPLGARAAAVLETPRTISDELPLPLATGVVVAAAGATAHQASLNVAYGGLAEAAQAAVRLRGFDALAVHTTVVSLTPTLADLVEQAAREASSPPHDWPVHATPSLDLDAARHAERAQRYFDS